MIVRELATRFSFNIDQNKLKKLDRSLQTITRKAEKAGKSMMNVGKKMTAYVSLPIIAAGVFALKTSSDFEQLDIAFTTMLGSAEKAGKLTRELYEFAARTPFEVKGIGKSAKQLLAVGMTQEEILPTLKALGDVASGVSVPLERLILNFGQVKTQGKLTGRELRDFAIAGVPLLGVLAKQLNKSEKEVQKLVSRGDVSFDDVQKAFKAMTGEGGKFADLMKKQSKTLGGIFSNFLDIITLTSKEFGDILAPTAKRFLKILTNLTWIVKNLTTKQKKWVVSIFAITAATGILLTGLGAVIYSLKILRVLSPLVWKTFWPVLLIAAKFALIIAGIVAVALAANDLYAFMNGGASRTGDAIDEHYGEGKSKEVRRSIKDVWESYKEWMNWQINAAKNLGAVIIKPWVDWYNFIKGRIDALKKDFMLVFGMYKSMRSFAFDKLGISTGNLSAVGANGDSWTDDIFRKPSLNNAASMGKKGGNINQTFNSKVEVNVETGADADAIGKAIVKKQKSSFGRDLKNADAAVQGSFS